MVSGDVPRGRDSTIQMKTDATKKNPTMVTHTCDVCGNNVDYFLPLRCMTLLCEIGITNSRTVGTDPGIIEYQKSDGSGTKRSRFPSVLGNSQRTRIICKLRLERCLISDHWVEWSENVWEEAGREVVWFVKLWQKKRVNTTRASQSAFTPSFPSRSIHLRRQMIFSHNRGAMFLPKPKLSVTPATEISRAAHRRAANCVAKPTFLNSRRKSTAMSDEKGAMRDRSSVTQKSPTQMSCPRRSIGLSARSTLRRSGHQNRDFYR